MIPSYGNPDRLILFTRYPESGKVKTRLIPALGPEGSCELHRLMTERTVHQLRIFSAARPEVVEVRFEGGNEALMKIWLGPDLHFHGQGSGDLGLRLEQAFQEAFQSGAKRVVIVGSDCPGLTPEILRKAFGWFCRNSDHGRCGFDSSLTPPGTNCHCPAAGHHFIPKVAAIWGLANKSKKSSCFSWLLGGNIRLPPGSLVSKKGRRE